MKNEKNENVCESRKPINVIYYLYCCSITNLYFTPFSINSILTAALEEEEEDEERRKGNEMRN